MVEEVYGRISWSLASEIDYSAGTDIAVTIVISNPTAAEREYTLYLKYLDLETGAQIGTSVIVPVGDENVFDVPAEDAISLYGTITPEATNIIVAADLYDIAEEAIIGTVQTSLLQPTAGIQEWMPMVMTIAVLGMMFGMLRSIMPKAPKR